MISQSPATVRAYFVLCRMIFSESQGLSFASGVPNYASSTFLSLTAAATQLGSSDAINASAKMRSFSEAFSTHLTDRHVCAKPYRFGWCPRSYQMGHFERGLRVLESLSFVSGHLCPHPTHRSGRPSPRPEIL